MKVTKKEISENTKTVQIELKAAKRYQKAFTKNGIVVGEILKALKDSDIEIKGEIIELSRFGEAGEANLKTTEESVFLLINW